ncbi:MAG: GGDEF domain-containing protein [Demequinaceae bacterium]|nr:GGDEF domain-containing protein [Demequinaceae bacterium]
MRQWLSRRWRVLGHAGVRPVYRGDPRPIVATNQFAMLTSIVILPYALVMLVTSWPDLVSPALVFLCLVGGWVFSIFLNSRGLYIVASSLVLLLPILVLVHMTLYFTTESGFHYMLFAGGGLSFALFRSDQWTLRVVFIVVSVSALVFCEAMFPISSLHYEMPLAVIDWLRGINIALTVLLLYVVGRFDLHYYERERRRNVSLLESAQVAAQTDALTEVYNRRGIAPILSSIARRGDYALGLVDLDRFKLINDRLGHGAGDVVLANAARTLVRSVGDYGTVARWGGEEFLVVLPGMSLVESDALMERLREDMEAEHGAPDSVARVTVSVGLAHAPRYSGKEEVLRLADANLYEAKSSGRNVVVSARLTPQGE